MADSDPDDHKGSLSKDEMIAFVEKVQVSVCVCMISCIYNDHKGRLSKDEMIACVLCVIDVFCNTCMIYFAKVQVCVCVCV